MKNRLSKDEKTARYTELITEARNGYERYKRTFLDLQNAYLLNLDSKKLKELKRTNRSNLFIPKINSRVKYLITALNGVYFGSERMADLEYYMNSNEELLNMWQEAIDFYCEKLNMFKIFQPFFLDCSLVGTAIAKVTWKDGLNIEKVDIENIFFDPHARSNEDISYLVNEIFLNYEQIKFYQKMGFYKKVNIDELINDDAYKKIKLYDIYEKKDDSWVVSTMLENELLRDELELNDGLPFIWGSMLAQIKKIDEDENFICAYGEPPFASAMPLQQELNIARNLVIDASRTHLSPKIVIPKSADVSREDLVSIGKPIYISEPTGINILPQPNIQSTILGLEILESEITEVTGISPQNNGAQSAKDETATEISIKAEEGGRRSGDYIRHLNETFIEPLFERIALLVYRYADDEFFNGYEREDMPSFRFKIQTGTGANNKEVRRIGIQNSMQVFSQLYQMYMSVGDTQNAYKIVKASENLAKELLPILGIKNVSDFLSDEVMEQGQAMQEAQEQEQIMQEQAMLNQGI